MNNKKTNSISVIFPSIEEITRLRKPEEFKRDDYADLDFDAMIEILHARSIAWALLTNDEDQDTIPWHHRDNCLSAIDNMLSREAGRVD
jgi:hypothetical protein